MITLYITVSLLIGGALYLNRGKLMNVMLVLLFLAVQGCYTIYEYYHKGIPEFSFFTPDAIALILLITLTIISIPALLHSIQYNYSGHETPRTRSIYYAAMVVLVMTMSAAYLSSHFAVTWIFVELTTLSASALIFHRRNAGSIEATWKYVFVSSISLVFVFIGILLLSIAVGTTGEESLDYAYLTANASRLDPLWLKLAFIFIFSGYTVKLGLVPMYTAGIDAKDKAPTPAAALFSSALMNVGFIGVFRMYQVVSHTSIHGWVNHIIMLAAFLSVFIATVYLLRMKNIKRMLAYSSIEHMGILMLGFAAGGIGYYAAVLHLVFHSFIKSALFLHVGHIYKTYKTKNIYAIGNYFTYNTTGAVFMIAALICITAMPPSGLFISEFYIFKALFEARYLYVLIPVLILLAMIVWILSKSVIKMLFIPPVKLPEQPDKQSNTMEVLSQFILLALTIYLGLNPPEAFVSLIHEAVSILN